MLAEKRIENGNGLYVIDGGKGTLSLRQIENRAKKILEIDAEIKRLQDLRDGLKNEIIGSMDGDKIETGKCKIAYIAVTTSRFDSRSFKKDYPELYPEYCKTSETRRFTVSAK